MIRFQKKIFINLVPIERGGGLQNAISFLKGFIELEKEKYIYNNDFHFIIKNNIILESICKDNNLSYDAIRNGLPSRIRFELFYFIKTRNNIIFTLFGGKPLISNRNINIVGCAYSNLFYPEIKFWDYLSLYKKIEKYIIDKYRYYFIRKSDAFIFETEILAKRAVELFNFPRKHTYVVRMAVSPAVYSPQNANSSESFKKISKSIINIKKFKILYLAGAHPNKRQHLIINIIKELLINKCTDICFVTTMENNNYSARIISEIKRNKYSDYFLNIGPIESDKCGEIIKKCDALINIAKLESFSNNFIEAWAMKKPLIVADSDWARDICDKSAIYLNMNNLPKEIYKIVQLRTSEIMKYKLIQEGEYQLRKYPTFKEKVINYLTIIKKYDKDK